MKTPQYIMAIDAASKQDYSCILVARSEEGIVQIVDERVLKNVGTAQENTRQFNSAMNELSSLYPDNLKVVERD